MAKARASKQKSQTAPPAGLALAVIGTDTEVGKTIIAAALARAFAGMGLRVGVYKPFASDPARRPTGEGFSTDADLLARAAGMAGGAEAACGQLFATPLSPLAAAQAEGRRVDIPRALAGARRVIAEHDITLVEGCGGWEVPLTPSKTTAEFFEALGAPAVLVARAGLGTINHSLLTIAAARARGVEILGVILNRQAPAGGFSPESAHADPSESTNAKWIAKFGAVKVWGPLDHAPALAALPVDRVAVNDLPNLAPIARALLRSIPPRGE